MVPCAPLARLATSDWTPIAIKYVAQALSELGANVDLLAFPVGREVAISNVHITRCANPLAGAVDAPPGLCGACLAHRPPFDATIAAVDYASPLDQLVLQLKFGQRLALAPWCARMLVDAVLARPDLVLPDLLLPVPLGRQRLAERGFNQALEIARPLARALGVPLQARLAVRAHDTLAQSSLAPGARQANVRHAFALAPQLLPLVRGRHIGLVDDVMSSGHTLGELAALCKRFGATRVSNLVFARTPPH